MHLDASHYMHWATCALICTARTAPLLRCAPLRVPPCTTQCGECSAWHVFLRVHSTCTPMHVLLHVHSYACTACVLLCMYAYSTCTPMHVLLHVKINCTACVVHTDQDVNCDACFLCTLYCSRCTPQSDGPVVSTPPFCCEPLHPPPPLPL